MRFHPWVFSGAIAQIVGEPAEGDIVGVFSQGGDFLAYGHYQIGSIAVRVLSFAGEDVLSPDFWKNMIAGRSGYVSPLDWPARFLRSPSQFLRSLNLSKRLALSENPLSPTATALSTAKATVSPA